MASWTGMAKPKSVSRSGRPSETSVGASDGERPDGEVVGEQGSARAGFRPRIRAWYCQTTSDQAEPIAVEVDHRRTAIAGIERRLDLDQAAELSSAQFQCSIEPGHMATADRVPHPERVTDDEHLASQVGHAWRPIESVALLEAGGVTASSRSPGRLPPSEPNDDGPRSRAPRSGTSSSPPWMRVMREADRYEPREPLHGC